MEDGAIYSNLNDYIEKWSLEDTKVADIYEKSNEAAMDGGATYRYNYISEYNSASSFEQFFMEDPEDFRADKVPDLNYFSEEVEELNQYIESYNNNEIESKSVTIDKSFLIDDEGLGM